MNLIVLVVVGRMGSAVLRAGIQEYRARSNIETALRLKYCVDTHTLKPPPGYIVACRDGTAVGLKRERVWQGRQLSRPVEVCRTPT